MNNYAKLTEVLNTVEHGRDADIVKVFKAAKGLHETRGAIAEASRETGRSKSTLKSWSLMASAWFAVSHEGSEGASDFRQAFYATKASTKRVEEVLAEGFETLDEFIEAITPEVAEVTEGEGEGEDTGKGETELVEVVLSALPHLSAEDLARVAEAVAELATAKAFELV